MLDGRLGAAGPLSGPNYAIGSALGQQVGTNLFHSFSQFSLASGESATFSGPAGITNIVGRVTGGTPSSIDGTVRSTISGASLWLFNPNGMAFGPNARLDVQGSFHASTASYLKLGASGRFDAANPGASVLTVDAPVAFGFLGTPAALTVDRSQLKVPLGSTLSLVGGDLSIAGTSGTAALLEATGGKLNLASLAAPGEVAISSGVIGTPGASALGSISIANATVRTDDPNHTPGPITIRGGKLALASSTISTLHFQPSPGSDIDIGLSGDMAMTGGVIRTTSLGPAGDAGNVSIRAASVSLDGGALIDSSAFFLAGSIALGGGHAGNTVIAATGDVSLAGGSQLRNITFASGTPSETRITARDLAISGNSGINVATFGNGDAGNVSISVRDLTLSSGGHISATPQFDISTTPGSGAGGRIDVSATGTVAVTGAGSAISTSTASLGAGGSIAVSARDIVVADGGRISSRSEDPFGLAGDAGSIALNATGSVRLQGGASVTTQSVTRNGGSITIRAADTLALTDSSIITSVKDSTGNGGEIRIDPVFVVLNNGTILSQADLGNGGNITISTQYLLQSPDSLIDATSLGGGLSGTVLISSPVSDIGTRLAALPSAYVDASQLLREACGARAVGNSFTGVGRGGLPASPDSAGFASYAAGSGRTARAFAPLLFSSKAQRNASVLQSCPG